MPIYNYICKECQEESRVLSKPNLPAPKCVCGGELTRRFNPPTTHVKEVLDNGIMKKSIERFSNAEDLFKDRANGKNQDT